MLIVFIQHIVEAAPSIGLARGRSRHWWFTNGSVDGDGHDDRVLVVVAWVVDARRSGTRQASTTISAIS